MQESSVGSGMSQRSYSLLNAQAIQGRSPCNCPRPTLDFEDYLDTRVRTETCPKSSAQRKLSRCRIGLRQNSSQLISDHQSMTHALSTAEVVGHSFHFTDSRYSRFSLSVEQCSDAALHIILRTVQPDFAELQAMLLHVQA